MSKPVLRVKNEGEVWNVLGETIVCKVRGEETFGRFAVVEETSPPKGVVPLHFHNQTDEIIYVLEGEYEIVCGDKTSIAESGSSVVIPRGTPHSIRNRLTTPSKMLAIITPSGFENFFAEINNLTEIIPEKIIEIGKRNDLELVM